MAIKMRVLCYPEKKKLLAIGNAIKAKYQLNPNSVDRIPPAYSCDKERLVVLALNLKGSKLSDDYRLFIQDLNKTRAANVAIIYCGDEALLKETQDLVTAAGANLIDEVKYTKVGLFDSKASDDELSDIYAWIDRAVANLK